MNNDYLVYFSDGHGNNCNLTGWVADKIKHTLSNLEEKGEFVTRVPGLPDGRFIFCGEEYLWQGGLIYVRETTRIRFIRASYLLSLGKTWRQKQPNNWNSKKQIIVDFCKKGAEIDQDCGDLCVPDKTNAD